MNPVDAESGTGQLTDLAWLAERIGIDATAADSAASGMQPADSQLAGLAAAGRIVEPTAVKNAQPGVPAIALIGWPTGRHHSLIKAAEARLALEEGATEVWVAADPELLARGDINPVLADLIAVSQAVDGVEALGVSCPASAGAAALQALADAAARAAFTHVAVQVGNDAAARELRLPDTPCALSIYGFTGGAGMDVDAAVDFLLAGAQRVFVPGP